MGIPKCLTIVFLISYLVCLSWASSRTDVSLTEPVQMSGGVQMLGINGTDYQSFVGIPFAQPPVNKLRFANPRPKVLPPGRFKATTNPPQCIQMNFLLPQRFVAGNEDCLYLNVYRPHRRSRPGQKLPVMVYIHGGGFFSGTMDPAIVGPKYFMKTGEVILVALQYRLSSLGFFATGDASASGNFGLKDQALALQWVKDNIEQFGGDSNMITIFGQSAGAASVHMQMISPPSRGLFNRAIAISGNALGPYNYPTTDPESLARKHADVLGVANASFISTSELVDRLREVSASDLISSVQELKFFDVDSLTVYRTVKEPKGTPGAFLTESPMELLKMGQFANVPYMAGLVENEGAVRAAAIVVNDNLTQALNEDIRNLIPQLMELSLEGEAKSALTDKIIDRYLGNAGKLTPENGDSFMKMYSDRSFVYPQYKQLELMDQASNYNEPIFTYYFNYRGENSYAPLFTGTLRDFGVVHCDDLIYLFESPLLFPNGLSARDMEISDLLVGYYVKFAKGENPWPRTRNHGDKIGPYWNVAEKKEGFYRDFELVRFWDQAKEYV